MEDEEEMPEQEFQKYLKNAFDKRNLELFSKYISMRDAESLMYDQTMTIYHKTLSTAGCAAFVQKCLKSPWALEYMSSTKSVFYATMSMDPDILRLVLPNVYVNEKVDGLTPLNYLTKHVKKQNVEDVFKCIELLLEHYADPEIFDTNGETSLDHLQRNANIDETNKHKIGKLLTQGNCV